MRNGRALHVGNIPALVSFVSMNQIKQSLHNMETNIRFPVDPLISQQACYLFYSFTLFFLAMKTSAHD